MGSLFDGLFAAPKKQETSSLFLSDSKYRRSKQVLDFNGGIDRTDFNAARSQEQTDKPTKVKTSSSKQTDKGARSSNGTGVVGKHPKPDSSSQPQVVATKEKDQPRKRKQETAEPGALVEKVRKSDTKHAKKARQPDDVAVGKQDKALSICTDSETAVLANASEAPVTLGKGKKKNKRNSDTEKGVIATPASGVERVVVSAKGSKLEEQPRAKTKVKDDPEKLQRTVFVGNVPASAKSKKLKHFFSEAGTVESVRLRSVPIKLDAKLTRRAACTAGHIDADRGAAHAYVVFTSQEAVPRALQMNMREFGGQHLRVDVVKDKDDGSAVQYNPQTSVFVGNLHFETKDEELIQLFNTGEQAVELQDAVEAVRVVRDGATNIGKGFAFVLFKTKAAARAAKTLNGTELRGRALRVTGVSGGRDGGPRNSSMGAGKAPEAGQQAKGALQRGPKGQGAKDGTRDKTLKGVPSTAVVGASWQGLVVKGSKKGGKGVRLRGAHSKVPGSPGERKAAPKSKRPAVAARKQRQLAATKAGGVQKKAPGNDGKGKASKKR